MNSGLTCVMLLKTSKANERAKRERKENEILRPKRAFKMKQKAFFIIFKGLSLKLFFGR